MFNSARLKLTGWYLLIIMVISISFSVVIYRVLTIEVDRLMSRQSMRLEQQLNDDAFYPPEMRGGRFAMPALDPELVEELKGRLIFNLGIINGLILFGAGGLGFALAGKTLKPIKVMLEEQNRFVADASHELRTPLTALKTTLEVTLRDKKLSLKDARETLLANLEDVNRLQALSDGLLALAQFQQPSRIHAQSQSELIPVVQEALKVVKSLTAEKAIKVVKDLEECSVAISTKELRDVLIILLDNAIKYSPAKTTIHITATKHDGQVLIKIGDQGVGIAASELPHIFDRFYQVDSSRSSDSRTGYGLGLAIAKQTIERNHGTISVASEPAKGTTFSLKLHSI